MSNKKILIVLSEELQEEAKLRANRLFAKNFSAYIAHLIAKDIEKNPTSQGISNTSMQDGNIVGNSGNVSVKRRIKK